MSSRSSARDSLFESNSDGTVTMLAPQPFLDLVADLARSLDELIDADGPELQRLFPTAYPDDPERDAGYQILARSELIDQRHRTVATVVETAHTDSRLSEEALNHWMTVVNDLRLVLGTKLDIQEDDRLPEPHDPNRPAHEIYLMLGEFLSEIVDVLTGRLPPPSDAQEQ